MANINLSDYKASGTYFREIDSTIRTTQATTQNRIIIGFSRKGPFNTPVTINSVAERTEVFGDIDTFLERRGSYFHRSIDIALEEGPVIALALLPLNDMEEGDKVDYQALSVSQAEKNSTKLKTLYSSFYDKEKFWKPSTENFKAITDTFTPGKLLSFVNLSQDKYSIIIRKAEKKSVDKFNILVQDFYGKNNVPTYLDPLDYLSDYFVEVSLYKGNLTNYSSLSQDPVYSKYFSNGGLLKSQIATTRASSDFELVSIFYGTVIPNFFDGGGVSYSIDNVINTYTSKLGLMAFLDSDYLESLESLNVSKLDLVGHSLVQEDNTIEDLDYLSYKLKLYENLVYTKKTSFTETSANVVGSLRTSLGTGQSGLFYNTVLLQGTSIQGNITSGSSLVSLKYGRYGKIKSYATTSGNTLISYTNPMKSYEGSFRYSVQASNPSANTVTIDGIHSDFGYDMTGKDVLVYNDFNKFYYTISSYATHSGNGKTQLFFSSSENLNLVNETYKVTWAAGYTLLSANSTANTVTIAGKHDFSNIYTSLTGNVIYLKSNSDRLGNLSFSSHSYDNNNNTVLALSNCFVKLSNGSMIDIVSSNLYSEVLDNTYYVTYGYNSIAVANITSGAVKVISEPDLIQESGDTIVAYKQSTLSKGFASGNVTVGDYFYSEDTPSVVSKYYLSYENSKDIDDIEVIKLKTYTDSSLTEVSTSSITFGNKQKSGSSYIDMASNEIAVSSKIGNINQYIEIVETFDNGTRIRLSSTNAADVTIGDYINSYTIVDDNPVYFLSKVYSKKKLVIGSVIYYDIYIPRTAKLINDGGTFKVEKYKDIENFVESYNLFALDGFKMTDYNIPGNSLNASTQLEKILGVLENTGLYNALADRNMIDYRYIVDTFDTYIFNGLYPKDVLTRLAKKQGKSIAFINSPKIETFVKSNSPSPVFVDYDSTQTIKKVFNPKYVATGGNQELSPSFLFNLPTEEQGSKYGAIFGPYLKLQTVNGNIIDLPPAPFASNLFVRRLNSGEKFQIAAGTRRGAVTTPRVVDLEYSYSDDDRLFLEPAGWNCFVKKPGYGIILYSDQTMYQKFESALNNLNVRDIIVTVERGIDNILQRYVFDSNTPNTRLQVADDVRTYLKSVLSEGGIYRYNVTMDDKNNTPATIDQNLGIIDISIEPVLGMKVIVATLTIQRTQGIQNSGFAI